jgi:O-antigen/teichoic acid export membrane protein
MSAAPVAVAPPGLWRSTLTLLVGGVVAQALPLLLGPWLTRLYSPGDWGQFALFSTVAANLAVVACARYEYALPMAADEEEARELMALCLYLLIGVTALSVALAVALTNIQSLPHAAWLPWAVAASGAAQWLTLWATRAHRFKSLAAARATQFGGAALVQAGCGVALGGVAGAAAGLIAGPIVASVAALAWLRHPAPAGGWGALWRVPRTRLAQAARKHRSFPLFNTPHTFANALSDTFAIGLLVAATGDASAGFWGLCMRYLKAPATLVGGALSQALYPSLVGAAPHEARATVRRAMGALALVALPLVLLLLFAAPELFAFAFGERWRPAGDLARALAPYIGVHFIASPLAVVTMAWNAQAWALRLALIGQAMFLAALAAGLHWGGLLGGAWAVSAATMLYFGWYFWSLATWSSEVRRD